MLKTEERIKINSQINLNRIKSAKTLAYLNAKSLINTVDLDKIKPICFKEESIESFYKHHKSYEVEYSLDKVWDAYLNIPPAIAWGGSKIGFSFSYDPNTKAISYVDDVYKGINEKQLIFIEIKLLFGLLKLAVTHYVNEVNQEEKIIKLCYTDGGKSAGSQFIKFQKISENTTKIMHDTYYKSDSKFRDEKLYPKLHEMIINQFHHNVFKYLAC